jgi:hypothetical protein
MGTLLDLASLVVVPSGYKEDKIYSVVPTDGSGDLDFTRASDATRVNSAGLIEKVRTNLLTYSEEFDNAAWVKQNITVSPNTQTAPDGTLSADKVIVDNGAEFSAISNYCRTAALTLTTGVVHTVSVYAKADGFDILAVRMSTATTMGAGPTLSIAIDLTTGVAESTSFGTYIGREAAANGYYRYIFQTVAIASATNYLSFVPRDTTATEGNGVDGISIWGAQIEIGDIATDYIPTTSAAVSVGMTADVPRLDYSQGSCPSLLLEPQRINLVLYSEQFDNAGWGKFQASVTANTGTSPDGYSNADKLIPSIVLDVHQTSQVVTLADDTNYAFSCFAKADGYNFLRLAPTTKAGTTSSTFFNLSTGAVGTVGGGHTASIENYGNGWYRCTIVYNSGSGASSTTQRVAVSQSDNQTSFAGNGTDGILLYGAQIEEGSYPTSYIPTLGTSVTRVEDNTSKTSITSLIGQTEGTIFVEMDTQNISEGVRIIEIGDGTVDNRIVLRLNASTVNILVTSSGVSQVGISSGVLTNGNYKIALGYAANNFALFINGTLRNSSASGSVPSCPNLYLGYTPYTGSPLGGLISQALLFKTRLSNTELAQITTL